MATYQIPKNAGKFAVVVARGGHFAVWNGKQGKKKGEVSIPVRDRKQAQAICDRLNRGEHNGTVSVFG